MTRLVYLLFFCSGLSGLIYQVIWVRVFGNVFGNTIYSASLVVAVFMLGLGVGSYIAGAWADRRYATRPESLIRAYGYFELGIAVLGLVISAVLPHLDRVSAVVSFYTREASGWYVLSTTSYLARAAIAVVLLTPITLLMGGTLTLLIRHLVRNDFEAGGWRIAVLYAVNTAGAALGCFLTDFALVPSLGLLGTQLVAVFFNIVAALGALYLAFRPAGDVPHGAKLHRARSSRPIMNSRHGTIRPLQTDQSGPIVTLTSLALAMTGFAYMGMEIVWFRHFSVMLGAFRTVFALLLTVILVGIGVGSILGGIIYRRGFRPIPSLLVVQALFVVSALFGFAIADARSLDRTVSTDLAFWTAAGGAVNATQGGESGLLWTLTELWFNARPILLEVAVPALLMGFSFPLGNAVIQRAEPSVGRRAGMLYLANTAGAVGGALACGFLLLPIFGLQGSATVLALVAGLALVPLYFLSVRETRSRASAGLAGSRLIAGASVLATIGTLALWLLLPSDYVNIRALAYAGGDERLITRTEGLTEIVAVTEAPGKGRTLYTNGHPMSSTRRLAQRYMRALAHIPLLCIDNPQAVLVIGFGVGNTTHAATLHPSIRRVEVADLSREILTHSPYFSDVNRDVLTDPRVVVYVNDGRHHLQMQEPASYDLIALEPPPVGYAGVASLYSREFYALARTRLEPKGYVSQWLPAYQMPTRMTLAMIRAFVDVFPQAVLLSGAEADLLLVGTKDSHIEIDPARLDAALSSAPAVREDLQRLDLGSVREIVGAFVGSARTLAEATRDLPPVTDDRPIQEYGVMSLLNLGAAVPASVVDLSQVGSWCPKCFAAGTPVPLAEGLDTYLALLARAYTASPAEVRHARHLADTQSRLVAGSRYLGAIVPESADLHNLFGIALAGQGQLDKAIAEFREALRLAPDSAATHWHLGAALASGGARQEAIAHLRRSAQLDPGNSQARYDLASLLLEARDLDEAVREFRATLALAPDSVEAHNHLGLALALQGQLDEAVGHFQRALKLDPASADARRNLSVALRQIGKRQS